MESDSEPKEASNTEDYQVGISLRKVSPVDVRVRNISVTVNNNTNGAQKFRNLFPTREKTKDVENDFPSTTLLDNVSADMPHGSLTAIIGASGSGKTTL
jgi:ABC-type multidrug transport system ATPase subunit